MSHPSPPSSPYLSVPLSLYRSLQIPNVCFPSPFNLNVSVMSTSLSQSVCFEASPSVEDSSPGLQDFLRTIFGNIASPTRDFTVTVCRKTQTRPDIKRHLVHSWISPDMCNLCRLVTKQCSHQHLIDKTFNIIQRQEDTADDFSTSGEESTLRSFQI